MCRRCPIVLLWLCASAFAADIGIDFVGVMGTGKDVRVSLRNQADGKSQWVAVGRDFAGYTLAGYDPAQETVTMKKDGRQYTIGIKQGKTQAGSRGEPPEPMRGAILNNLRQLCAAADQFYLENGKSRTTYDEIVGPTKYVKQVSPVDGENYRQIVFEQGRTLTVKTASGFTMSYAP